jgi:hypothetical protein
MRAGLAAHAEAASGLRPRCQTKEEMPEPLFVAIDLKTIVFC